MRLADFEQMVRRMGAEVPPHFLDGVDDIVVSPQTRPHPLRGDVYTLGECVPLDRGDRLASRIVLYHGSFAALARITDAFDWRAEAWETLTHELRHHLEWGAGTRDLDAFDRAAEQNFARHDGEPFDPLFFLDGEPLAPGVYQVDDDVFLDRVVRRRPARVDVTWHGASYRITLDAAATLPAFIALEQIDEPPPGELVLVLRRRPSLLDLVRQRPLWCGRAGAERLPTR